VKCGVWEHEMERITLQNWRRRERAQKQGILKTRELK
jgi:hypothetical protein